MLLLIFVTIFIYRAFARLAKEKDLPHVKWGLYGSLMYLGVSIGGAFLTGVIWALQNPYVNISGGTDILISLVFYSIGGFCSYLLYHKLKKKPGFEPDLENFGKPANDN